MRSALLVLVGTLLLLHGPVAWAQSPGVDSLDELELQQKEELIEILRSAKSAYANGDFEAARALYHRAYGYYRHPNYLYRIAVCLERTDQPGEALEYYRRYLKAEPDSGQRGKVEASIAALEEEVAAAQLASLEIRTDPPNAKIYLGEDEEFAGKSPLQVELEPGRHRVGIRAEGHEPRAELVELEAGAERTLELALQPLEETTPEGPDETGRPTVVTREEPERRVPGVLLGFTGLAAASTVGATLGWFVANGAYDDLDKARDERADERRKRIAANAWAAAAWGAGAITAVLAGLTFYRWSRPASADSASLALAPSGRGAVVSWTVVW